MFDVPRALPRNSKFSFVSSIDLSGRPEFRDHAAPCEEERITLCMVVVTGGVLGDPHETRTTRTLAERNRLHPHRC